MKNSCLKFTTILQKTGIVCAASLFVFFILHSPALAQDTNSEYSPCSEVGLETISGLGGAVNSVQNHTISFNVADVASLRDAGDIRVEVFNSIGDNCPLGCSYADSAWQNVRQVQVGDDLTFTIPDPVNKIDPNNAYRYIRIYARGGLWGNSALCHAGYFSTNQDEIATAPDEQPVLPDTQIPFQPGIDTNAGPIPPPDSEPTSPQQPTSAQGGPPSIDAAPEGGGETAESAAENAAANSLDVFSGPTSQTFADLNPLRNNPQLNSPGGIVGRLLTFAFPLAGLILFAMIVWGGFEMLTSAATSKGVEAGRQRVTNALIGFIVLFSSYWIIQIVQAVFGVAIL